MRNTSIFLFLLSLSACNLPAPRADDDTLREEEPLLQLEDLDCTYSGEVLPGNRFLLRELQKLAILSVSKEDASNSLEIFSTEDCSIISKFDLPLNEAPDFPYYLAQIMYNNESKVLGIRGYDKICLYDAMNDTLSAPLTPAWAEARNTYDADSGRILRLEVWEDFLVGYAAGKGTFIFNIQNPSTAEAVLPVAEYKTTNDDYSSLFLLESKGEKTTYQAVLPYYDYTSGTFEINSLFREPLNIQNKSVSQKGNTVVLRDTGKNGKEYTIDMLARKIEPE